MNRLPAPILVATDASDDAHTAMRAAASLARGSGSPLHIVHVWQMPFSYGVPLQLIADPALEDEAGATILDLEREFIEDGGASVAGAHLRRGTPALAILAVADMVHAGLVVVGRRGLGAVRRVVMGSVSDGVVRQSTAPVLVVHGDQWPPSRVVVGEDGSAESHGAADLAADVAAVTGAPIMLVRALPHLGEAVDREPVLAATLVDDVLGYARADLEDRATALGGRVPSHVEVSTDEPWEALDEAAQNGSALVVVGHRRPVNGHRPPGHSVAERVLHHAGGSVLIVPGGLPGAGAAPAVVAVARRNGARLAQLG
jgi:nucleotide-binding universal stress UspA family protein